MQAETRWVGASLSPDAPRVQALRAVKQPPGLAAPLHGFGLLLERYPSVESQPAAYRPITSPVRPSEAEVRSGLDDLSFSIMVSVAHDDCEYMPIELSCFL